MSACVYGEKASMADHGDVWVTPGLKKQEGTCADGEYTAIPFHKMQTCAPHSKRHLWSWRRKVSWFHCPVPPCHCCPKTLVALFTHAEGQKSPWDLEANVYPGACNSHADQGGQKAATAPSTFSISPLPICEDAIILGH